jgi:PPOX class probable F420-dependent enzyme
MEKKLEQFAEKQFLNLETFRKSGVGVPTPVWFAERNGNLYVRTIDNSGKVKRIRNNGRVRVAPCDARGMLEGEWVEAQARLVEGEIASIANALLDKKYGFQKKMFDLIASLRKNKHAIIEIQFD